jgi:hypothetical protein
MGPIRKCDCLGASQYLASKSAVTNSIFLSVGKGTAAGMGNGHAEQASYEVSFIVPIVQRL